MREFIVLVIGAILVENFVVAKFLGICPFLGVSKKLETALGMSGAVIFVMTIASAVTWILNKYLLVTFGLGYLQTIAFILVIAALVQFVEIVLKKFIPPLYRALGIYLPLITTNCAVLGVALINIQREYSFAKSVLYSFGAGLGFTLALVLFAGVRERIEYSDIPESLKGLPITLIAAALVSVSFFGFQGLFSK
ncbi:MAG: electron transport complex subunit RsxA [Clostridia bacterium]|nr:electron transport complex subunit RsxA [Clostridia bacterium]